MARKQSKPPTDNIVALPSIYNETMRLLAMAHEHFSDQTPEHIASLEPRERMMATSEMSRISMRLSSVMSWLMVRNAVLQGKMTEAMAAKEFPLDCKDACLHQHIEAESVLSPEIGYLLDTSHELFERVCRLDEQLTKKPAKTTKAKKPK